MMFCLQKTNFVHSRSGTYYALLLGYFCLKFLPDNRYCVYWVFVDIWALDSSHKMGNKFFIYHYQGWEEGSIVFETVSFFRGWILIRLTRNLLRLFPNSVEILTWNFRNKLFRDIFSEICANQGYALPKHVEFRPTFYNFILGPDCAEKIHTSTFIWCLHLGKEARP